MKNRLKKMSGILLCMVCLTGMFVFPHCSSVMDPGNENENTNSIVTANTTANLNSSGTVSNPPAGVTNARWAFMIYLAGNGGIWKSNDS